LSFLFIFMFVSQPKQAESAEFGVPW